MTLDRIPPQRGFTQGYELHSRRGVVLFGMFCGVTLNSGVVCHRGRHVFTWPRAWRSAGPEVVPGGLGCATAGLEGVRVFMVDSLCSKTHKGHFGLSGCQSIWITDNYGSIWHHFNQNKSSHLVLFDSLECGLCVCLCGDTRSRPQNHQLLLLVVLDQPDK